MGSVYTITKFVGQEERLYMQYVHNSVNNAKRGIWQEIYETINQSFLWVVIVQVTVFYFLIFNFFPYCNVFILQLKKNKIDLEVNRKQDDSIRSS